MITRQYIRDNAPPPSEVFTPDYFKVGSRRKVVQVLQGMVQAGLVIRLEPNLYRMVPQSAKAPTLTQLLLENIPREGEFTYRELLPVIEGTRYSVAYLRDTLDRMVDAGHLKSASRKPRIYVWVEARAVSKPLEKEVDFAPGNAFLYAGLIRQ